MSKTLESLVASGTKLWLDSIDPELTIKSRKAGATGATSNPIIVSDLLKTGRFDKVESVSGGTYAATAATVGVGTIFRLAVLDKAGTSYTDVSFDFLSGAVPS